MKRFNFFVFLLPALLWGRSPQQFFVSPEGDDANPGLSIQAPLESISRAFQLAQAGDTINLLAGTYLGRTILVNQHGQPDQPIVLRSYAEDPTEFAIIDGQSAPSSSANSEGFFLQDCSWINFERLIFQNCWTHVIQLVESNYISIRSCHFSTGKRVIHAVGHQTHHVLVENCYIKHPHQVWQGWSWESLHHGDYSYYNGALLHPKESGGGHIMRRNTILNLYNAFRTRPTNIKEDGNIEIYENTMVNIRDNEFEPETWAWNMHYAYNRHINIHKSFSIDGVQGGNIYIFGNTFTQTTDPWAIDEVSGIFKYKGGPITYPCYAFNNSYYTEAKVMKEGEASNHLLKHFNNAYHFFEGSERFRISDWQLGYEFDYDCINQDWPARITDNQQEQHGLALTDPLFQDGLGGDFRLQTGSPCVDAGKVMQLPEFDWVQSYEGTAPDIGAFEGSQLADGPAFRFIPSPEGAFYQERPRISKFEVKGNQVYLYFTTELDQNSLTSNQVLLYENGQLLALDSISFPNHGFEMVVQTTHSPNPKQLSLRFSQQPLGTNGLSGTYWGSAIPIGQTVPAIPDLTQIADPFTSMDPVPEVKEVEVLVVPNPIVDPDSFEVVVRLGQAPNLNLVNHILMYSLDGDEIGPMYEPEIVGNEVHYRYNGDEFRLGPGVYLATVRVGTKMYATKFMVKP